jgi:hypothetical protein
VIQADVDANEVAATTDRALVRTEFIAADVLVSSVSATARGVIQADVDQNESDGDADRLLIRQEFAAADVLVGSVSSTARGVIQADVDANQAAAITDRALIRSQFAAADLVLTNAVAAHTVTLATKQNTIANDHLQIAHTAGLQTALDARLSSTGENQGITQNSTAAILTLTNMTGDRKTLSCVGGDGSMSIVGGVALECDREGPMYIRDNKNAGSVVLQARSTNAIIVDDKVTVPVSFVLTKAAPANEDAAGTHNELRVSGNTLYLYSSATSKWRTVASQGWA